MKASKSAPSKHSRTVIETEQRMHTREVMIGLADCPARPAVCPWCPGNALGTSTMLFTLYFGHMVVNVAIVKILDLMMTSCYKWNHLVVVRALLA